MARILASFWRRLRLLLALLLASFTITPGFTFGVVCDYSWLYFWRVKWSVDSFSFQISRISDHINVNDSFTELLDDSLKENQSLREQLRQRDEENALTCEELSNKANSSCKLVAENNSGSKETKSKKGNSKVHVPTSCAKPMRHFVSLCKKIFIFIKFVFFSYYPVYINL